VRATVPQLKGRRKEKFGGARRGKTVISPIHLTPLAAQMDMAHMSQKFKSLVYRCEQTFQWHTYQ
jgi:hypothetical protein